LTLLVIAAPRKTNRTAINTTMKLSWGVVASSLYCTVLAARPAVSPETARLIIAQRLGLSRFHSIEHADAETIRHINAFGGRQQKLFGEEDADRSRAHLLVWVEDAEQDEATGGQPPGPREECRLTKDSSHYQRRLRPHARLCHYGRPAGVGE
jgi:hypothetical protein